MARLASHLISALCILALTVGSVASAQTVQAEGSAAIGNGGVALARQAALRDAIRAASEMVGSHISSTTAVSAGAVVADNTRLSSSAAVDKVEVLEEWTEDKVVHVRANITLNPAGQCGPPRYRKRLAAVNFPLLDPGQQRANGVMGFTQGVPTEILRRLHEHGYLTVNASQYGLYPQPQLAPQNTVSGDALNAVPDLAHNLGVRYIVSGVIRDVGFEPLQRDGIMNLMNNFRPDKRRVEVEVFVHDGVSGALLLSRRFATEASGEVLLDPSVTFASHRFFASDFGRAMDQVLGQATDAVNGLLKCRPMRAQVLAIEDDGVRFDAGAEDGIGLGDTLTAYSASSPERTDSTGARLGAEMQPVAVLTVTRVYPRFAIARMEDASAAVDLKPGDQVRSW